MRVRLCSRATRKMGRVVSGWGTLNLVGLPSHSSEFSGALATAVSTAHLTVWRGELTGRMMRAPVS